MRGGSSCTGRFWLLPQCTAPAKEGENKSRIRMDVITPPHSPRTPPHPAPPHQCTAPAREQKKEKTKVAFAWTSSPLHPPNRAEREMQVQAGMCRKSSRPKYCKNRCRMRPAQENTEKNYAKCKGQHVLHSAARRLGHFFAIKHRKNRCESKGKAQLREK